MRVENRRGKKLSRRTSLVFEPEKAGLSKKGGRKWIFVKKEAEHAWTHHWGGKQERNSQEKAEDKKRQEVQFFSVGLRQRTGGRHGADGRTLANGGRS